MQIDLNLLWEQALQFWYALILLPYLGTGALIARKLSSTWRASKGAPLSSDDKTTAALVMVTWPLYATVYGVLVPVGKGLRWLATGEK